MFVRAIAMGLALIAGSAGAQMPSSTIPPASPTPAVSPSASPVPSPSPSTAASAAPALSYTLRCLGYGFGTFATAGILLGEAPVPRPPASGLRPFALAPLAPRRIPVTIVLLSGTLAANYWAWFAQGPSAKPVDCEIDRNDVDVSQRARFAIAGARIRNLAPTQPAPGSALGAPAADSVELDAASISLLTF
jgi:hypothetical protein